MRHPSLSRAVVESLELRRLLSASLVRDINLTTAAAQDDYGNQEITASGGNIYFRADDGIHGPQLWAFPQPASPNVVPTPVMVSDIVDPSGVGPTNLTDVNGTLFFTDDDAAHGLELWKTTGTLAGTSLVADINPGSGSSNPANLTNVNGTLFFSAYNSASVNGLYKSDGTSAGTVLVQSFAGLTYLPTNFTAAGSRLLFRVYSQSQSYLTYTSDGTNAGTIPLTDNTGALIGGIGTSYVTLNGVGYIGAGGLYQTDGTAAGTSLIVPADVEALTSMNGALYFAGHAGFALALTKSDGTAAGTSEVAELAANITYGSVDNLVAVNGTLLMEADSNSNGNLWRSDGTAAGTSILATVAMPVAEHANQLVVAGNEAYFIEFGDVAHSQELWKTDGTGAPVVVKDIRPGPVGALANEAEAGGLTTQDLLGTTNGTVYFSADDGFHGIELWQSDGTTANTMMVADINQETNSSNPFNPIAFDGRAFFSANDGVNGYGLWASDGTSTGTVLIASTPPTSSDVNGLNPSSLCVLGNTLYFSAYSAGLGYTLWQSDGTTAGTHVANLNPFYVTTPTDLTAVGNLLYFRAASGSTVGIFRTDGTGAGTVELVAFPFNYETYSPQITAVGQKAFFELQESSTQYTLYSSDGTVAGTTLFDSIPTQTSVSVGGGTDATLVSFDGAAYFTSSDLTNGNNLWRSDGTVAGTTLVKYISPGNSGLPPYDLVVAGSTLFFSGDDMPNGNELWKSDGTSAGTMLVKDANPGYAGSSPFWITAFGNQVVYSAKLPTGGFAPWISDGTAAGTFPLSVSTTAGYPGSYTVDGSVVYFSTADTAHGDELWSTDGTVAGTALAADISPGPASSLPTNMMVLPSGAIVFSASDPAHGDELWTYTAPGSISGSITLAGGTGGVAGATVYLDANGNSILDQSELSTTTASNGSFAFSNVPIGSYTIRQILPAGYTQSSPAGNAGIAVTIASGSVFTGENFVDVPPVVLKQLTGTTIGTSGSYKNDGTTIARATDGNLTTYFDGPTASGNWVGLDLGSSGGVVTTIKYASRSGWASRMNGGIFQASNSASFSTGVVNLFTIPSNANPSSTSLTTQAISNTTAYRYYRYLSPANSYGDVSEVQFFGTAGGLSIPVKLTGTTIGTAGSYKNDGTTIAKATDGNLSTYFDGPTANGNWVGLDLGSAKTIKQIAFAPRSGWASRMVGGQIQTSTTANFSSGVTTIYKITSSPTTGNLTTITLSSPVTARYVRYLSANGTYGDISEFSVLG